MSVENSMSNALTTTTTPNDIETSKQAPQDTLMRKTSTNSTTNNSVSANAILTSPTVDNSIKMLENSNDTSSGCSSFLAKSNSMLATTVASNQLLQTSETTTFHTSSPSPTTTNTNTTTSSSYSVLSSQRNLIGGSE